MRTSTSGSLCTYARPAHPPRPAGLTRQTIDFYNQINLLYGSIDEWCDEDKYPEMNAGPNYIYLWADGEKVKKPISVSARKYVDYLFTWIQAKFDDENVFPTSLDKPFPKDFKKLVSAPHPCPPAPLTC